MVFSPKSLLCERTWLANGSNKWVTVDLKPIKIDYPYFLFAFNSSENYTEAIPVDLIEIVDSIQTAQLALQKGAFNIIAQRKLKKAVKFELKVE